MQHIGAQTKEIHIKIDSKDLKQVDDFIYLGGTISDDASTDKDVQRRTGLACGVMQSLAPIWKSKAISTQTKVKVYETLVLSVLLYNSETWALKESTKKKLRVFEMSCLRKIKGVTRRNRVRNTVIRMRAEAGDRCRTKNPEKEVTVFRSCNADVRRKVTSNSILRKRPWLKEKRSSEKR